MQVDEVTRLDDECAELSMRVRQLREEEVASAPHVQSLMQASEDAQALKAEMATAQAEVRLIACGVDRLSACPHPSRSFPPPWFAAATHGERGRGW